MGDDIHVNIAPSAEQQEAARIEAMRLLAARSADDDFHTYKSELGRVYKGLLAELDSIRVVAPVELETLMNRVSALVDALVATGWSVAIAAEQLDKIRAEEGMTVEDYAISKDRLLDLVDETLAKPPDETS